MASGRVLSQLLRSTSLRLLKPAAFSSPRSPSPVPFSRPNPAGFLLSRAAQYATSDAAPPLKAPASPFAGPSGKITDEFTGAGAVGQVNGTEERRVLTGSLITMEKKQNTWIILTLLLHRLRGLRSGIIFHGLLKKQNLSEFSLAKLLQSSHQVQNEDQQMDVDEATSALQTPSKHPAPELEVYCYLLVLIFLIDQKRYDENQDYDSVSVCEEVGGCVGLLLCICRLLKTRRVGCVGANLFVGNLDPDVDEKLLYDTFRAFGVIVTNPKQQKPPE